MLNSPILDIAITLSFIYFMISLIVSSLNEFIYSFISRRGTMLKKSIEDLFFDQGDWKKFAQEKLFTNPQIQSLQKKVNQFPSYIPSKNFATALLDTFRKDGQILEMNSIRKELLDQNSLLPEQLKISLLSMFERAQGDLNSFQAEIETFYNNAMDRVAGWYKRETTYVIFGIAFILCVSGNIDTTNIVKQLWGDPGKREAATNQITSAVRGISYDTTLHKFSNLDSNSFAGISASYETIVQDTVDHSNKKITVNIDNGMKAGKTLATSGIPIGWTKENSISLSTPKASLMVKLIGWLITALAVMLGAPFWFDLMNKFISLRGSGKKPDTDDNKVVPTIIQTVPAPIQIPVG
ncbi:MAG TPA: hypothetical protein VNW06_12775 [Cytophagaceae bacterium]|jgi:hypothetical protein|nr:hypothetical protein [Cytophagaceae bacterium]